MPLRPMTAAYIPHGWSIRGIPSAHRSARACACCGVNVGEPGRRSTPSIGLARPTTRSTDAGGIVPAYCSVGGSVGVAAPVDRRFRAGVRRSSPTPALIGGVRSTAVQPSRVLERDGGRMRPFKREAHRRRWRTAAIVQSMTTSKNVRCSGLYRTTCIASAPWICPRLDDIRRSEFRIGLLGAVSQFTEPAVEPPTSFEGKIARKSA